MKTISAALLLLQVSTALQPHVIGRAKRPGVVEWTSRRGVLGTMASAPLFLLQASGVTEPASRLADPGNAMRNAQQAFQVQAGQAFQKITANHIQSYEQDGVTVVGNVVSKEWLQILRDGCETAQDEAGLYAEYLQQPTDGGVFFTDLELARRIPVFSAFSLYGPCAAVAGAIMESDSIRYLYDQLFVKEQGVSTHTPWHQDGGYWRVRGDKVGSVFVPLDPVKPEDGLAFVQGSHNWELHNPQHFADGTPYRGTSLPAMPNIDEMKERGDVSLLTFALQPGDVLVFSSRTVHGGPGNWGRALSTRWSGDATRYWDRPGEGAVPTGDLKLRDGDLLGQLPQAFPEHCKYVHKKLATEIANL